MKAQRIVVGYDGSDEARRAVSWAAAEAELAGLVLGSVGRQLMHHAGCPVLIVHADQVK